MLSRRLCEKVVSRVVCNGCHVVCSELSVRRKDYRICPCCGLPLLRLLLALLEPLGGAAAVRFLWRFCSACKGLISWVSAVVVAVGMVVVVVVVVVAVISIIRIVHMHCFFFKPEDVLEWHIVVMLGISWLTPILWANNSLHSISFCKPLWHVW